MALSLLFVALTACDGGDDNETTPTQVTPTQAATAAPTGTSLSGTATATVVVADQTLEFKNGKCEKGDDDSWLGVFIGQVGTDSYFEMLVGQHPGAGPDVKAASEGGEFTEGIFMAAIQDQTTFTMAPAEGNKIIVAADLSSGEFEGTTIDGRPISGSFHC